MLMPAAVWEAVQAAGLDLVARGPDAVELRFDDPDEASQPAAVEFKVLASARPLTPSAVRELTGQQEPGRPVLLIVPSATDAVRAEVAAQGWSVIVVEGAAGPHGQIRLGPDRVVPVGSAQPAVQARPARPGPAPWGTSTLLRRLLLGAAATQADLAARSGISQPRVSQVLKELSGEGLVERVVAAGTSRWSVTGWDALLGRWLSTYPGPGGIPTYWYGLDAPADQARAAVRQLTEAAGADAVVSGEVAADLLAPWRRPARAVVYARDGADLGDVELAPAGAAEATLELIVPADPGVWPAPPSEDFADAELPLADPLQVLWDLHRTAGVDAGEAADRLVAVLRRRARDAAATEPAGGADG